MGRTEQSFKVILRLAGDNEEYSPFSCCVHYRHMIDGRVRIATTNGVTLATWETEPFTAYGEMHPAGEIIIKDRKHLRAVTRKVGTPYAFEFNLADGCMVVDYTDRLGHEELDIKHRRIAPDETWDELAKLDWYPVARSIEDRNEYDYRPHEGNGICMDPETMTNIQKWLRNAKIKYRPGGWYYSQFNTVHLGLPDYGLQFWVAQCRDRPVVNP